MITYYVGFQSPDVKESLLKAQIFKTNFTRNRLYPNREGFWPQSSGALGLSRGGAILMGPLLSMDTTRGDFNLKRGELSCALQTAIFRSNVANNGGALASLQAELVEMDDVQFSQNEGADGGAVFLELNGDPNPRVGFNPINYVSGGKVMFQGKIARRGGALYTNVRCGTGLDLASISNVDISRSNGNLQANNEDAVFFENSRLTSNKASENGGAWYVEGGRVGFRNCQFFNNSLEGKLDGFGGAVFINDEAALHARNVTFEQNSAPFGGAVAAQKFPCGYLGI